ncbi:hypothetical protein ACA910_010384 [Epithemia clementina (nom. ined.)]
MFTTTFRMASVWFRFAAVVGLFSLTSYALAAVPSTQRRRQQARQRQPQRPHLQVSWALHSQEPEPRERQGLPLLSLHQQSQPQIVRPRLWLRQQTLRRGGGSGGQKRKHGSSTTLSLTREEEEEEEDEPLELEQLLPQNEESTRKTPLFSSPTTTTTTTGKLGQANLLNDKEKKNLIARVTSMIQRGGGSGSRRPRHNRQTSALAVGTAETTTLLLNPKRPPPPQEALVRNSFTVVFTLLLVGWLYQSREAWLPYLLDQQKLQDAVVQLLQGLRPPEQGSAWTKVRGYWVYGAGMTLWELLGLSTIPVETAAGMVFGWPWAAVASGSGKLLGASLAYGLGKWKLQAAVQNHALVRNNALCQLLAAQQPSRPSLAPTTIPTTTTTPTTSASPISYPKPHAPIVSALLMKFSCFPELIKNFGTAALLPSVTFGWFFLATFLHGISFTLLWTWLGVETALQLEQPGTPTSPVLQAILFFVLFILGFVLSPVSMAWWIRDLQRQQAAFVAAAAMAQQQQVEAEFQRRSNAKIWNRLWRAVRRSSSSSQQEE